VRESLDRAAFQTAHTPPRWGVCGQFVQQPLGVFKVGGVKAFGKPAVDFSKHAPCLVTALSRCEQSRKSDRRAKLIIATNLLVLDLIAEQISRAGSRYATDRCARTRGTDR
jgi:hypothetical protein